MNKFIALIIVLLLSYSIPAQFQRTQLPIVRSILKNPDLIKAGPANYSAAKCNSFADSLSILAAPCNGISVTSVTFNPASRTIETGTNNAVGVRYRYPNVGVAPDGTVIDALVTVVSYNNNQDSTPTTFRDADLPGATAGFDQNLQPSLQPEAPGTFIVAAPWVGNITYRIQFVVGGTSTPRVITVAATSIDNDGSTACGGLRERVTYSASNQILTSTTSNQTIAGSTVTGPLTTQNNIGVGPDFANAALFINVTEFNWTQGWTTAGNCTVGGASEVRYGSLNLACQINFGRNFASVSLSGNVFNDANGLTDSTVNGTGTNAGGLFANLIDANGFVVASVPVAANGTYSFPAVVAGNYNVQISTVQGIESSPMPATSLPAGWVNTGENIGTGAGNDGTANGLLPVTVGTVAITNANFGIEQRPVPGNNTAPIQPNPGGTTNLTVPATIFSATDAAPGTVTAIRITSFPLNITSITIGATTYTAATFPAGGVTVPTNAAGNPTQPIRVDPFDGPRTIDIPYVAIDNAGVESSTTAIARQPVSAGVTAGNASITGRVLDREGRGAARARVSVIDQAGNMRFALTNQFGYYRLLELEAGQVYVISVSHKQLEYQPRVVNLTEDFTDADFIPNP